MPLRHAHSGQLALRHAWEAGKPCDRHPIPSQQQPYRPDAVGCRFKEPRAQVDLRDTQTTMRLKDAAMTRNQLVRQLAEISTRPVGVSSASDTAAIEPASSRGS